MGKGWGDSVSTQVKHPFPLPHLTSACLLNRLEQTSMFCRKYSWRLGTRAFKCTGQGTSLIIDSVNGGRFVRRGNWLTGSSQKKKRKLREKNFLYLEVKRVVNISSLSAWNQMMRVKGSRALRGWRFTGLAAPSDQVFGVTVNLGFGQLLVVGLNALACQECV